VDDLDDIERHADQIAAAIFGRLPAPVAPPPAYAGLPVHKLAGLEPDDERIFVIACEQLFTRDSAHPIVDLPVVEGQVRALGMIEDRVYECIQVLEQRGYFHDVGHYLGENRPLSARVSSFAFERYLEAYRPAEYRDEKRRILSAIVNENMHNSRQIAGARSIHEYVVDHVIKQLESAGDVIASHHMQGIDVRPQPSLARKLRQISEE
jgi:hypothetical protein